jgi:hypothetical protein
MSDQPTRTLTIEVRSCDEPIRGEVAANGRDAIPFEGWLDLHWAIRRALETELAQTKQTPNTTHRRVK